MSTEYERAAHAMQSGVMMEMNYRLEPTSPKHLRVGINTAMVDHAGLVELLIDKGVITREWYIAAITKAMQDEKTRYEKHLSQLIGTNITLE